MGTGLYLVLPLARKVNRPPASDSGLSALSEVKDVSHVRVFLTARYLPTRLLRGVRCYAMSGTDIAHAYALRACYAVSGTDTGARSDSSVELQKTTPGT
eukprot:998155-Rhodomonas_salina.1